MIMKGVLTILFAIVLIHDSYADTIYAQKVQTVLEVGGYLIQNGKRVSGRCPPRHVGDMCEQINTYLKRRMGKLAENITSCIQRPTHVQDGYAYVYAFLLFHHPALVEHLIYNNERDFEFYLLDVMKYKPREGSKVEIDCVRTIQTGVDGLRFRFISKVMYGGSSLPYTKDLEDPFSEKYKKIRAHVLLDVKKIQCAIATKIQDESLGAAVHYFFAYGGHTIVVGEIYFPYESVVHYYGQHYSHKLFVDITKIFEYLRKIKAVKAIPFVKCSAIYRGDVTVINFKGLLFDGHRKADWSRELRISDSEVYKRITRQIIAQLSHMFARGSLGFYKAIYSYLPERFYRTYGCVEASIDVYVSQQRLHCEGFPSMRSKLQAKIEKFVHDWEPKTPSPALKQIEVKVKHVALVPKDFDCLYSHG